MKKQEIMLRQMYRVRIRGKVTIVDIRSEQPGGGWNGVEISTRRPVRIRTAERILCPCRSNGKAIPQDTFGVCKLCGCTDKRACRGGCSWVDEKHTLCSSCAEKMSQVPA